MSLKPKHTRLHEPKFKEREPVDIPEPEPDFDADGLARFLIKPLGPCPNEVLAVRLKEAGLTR